MPQVALTTHECAEIASALMYRAEQLDYAIVGGHFEGKPSAMEVEARVLRDEWRTLALKVRQAA